MPKYDYCEDCGQWNLCGYLPCKEKYICPNCAARIFKEDPVNIRAALTRQMVIDEMNINYACRALLGGGKGKSVMDQLQRQNPQYYQRIMGEAIKKLEVQGVKLSDV